MSKAEIACQKFPKFNRSSAYSRLRPNSAKSISQERSLWSSRTLGSSGDKYIDRHGCTADQARQLMTEARTSAGRHSDSITRVNPLARPYRS